jgi:hypothetical protein
LRSTSTVVALLFAALAEPVHGQPALLPPPASHAQNERPLIVLDVPFISQSEALCGGAAAAMVLRYWGERGLTAESFAHLVDRSAAGIRATALIGELRGRGWDATGIEGTEQLLRDQLVRGRPVMTLIEDRPGVFHYIVVVASTPTAVVFHDPARAPMRVISRDDFDRRWTAADRWMAVVVPGSRRDAAAAPPVPAIEPSAPCDQRVAEGIAQAQANDLSAAEISLTSALACPGSAPLRELAGVRLLQRRWPDVESLAGAAVGADPTDAHAWRLLGTSRFVQNDRLAALDAWNRVSEPVVDLVTVAGLERTRQRIVEAQLGANAGDLLTRQSFLRARRRLETLPAAAAVRLEYVPVPGGLVELRATVNERGVPSDRWTWAAIALTAGVRREIEYSVASLSGGGERLTAAWRFWPDRPKYSLVYAAPSPWGGLWAATISAERQPFDRPDLRRAERTTASLALSNWTTSTLHVAARAGIDDWSPAGTMGRAGATLRWRSPGDRVNGRLSADAWTGSSAFAMLETGVTVRSSSERSGWSHLARASAGAVSRSVPLDGWPGGDTGHVRETLLRAHPLLDDGRLTTAQLGRRIVAGSVEVQHWWAPPLLRIGAAAFVDAARVGSRLVPGARADVDPGAGLRLAVPGISGTFRADVAKGLRDGATTFSVVYEP